MRHIIIFLAFVSCISCSQNSDSTCERSYNVSFEIEEGREYCFPDGATLIIYELSDSYCPCYADCFWQGEALVKGQITNVDGDTFEIEIHEVSVDLNSSKYKIDDIQLNTDCTPSILNLSIIVSQ